MPTTYEPIATTTLGTTAANITFSSIPGTYTDLFWVLTCTGDATASGQAVLCEFNSDTAANYSGTQIRGQGTAASSTRVSNRNYFNVSIFVSIDTSIPIMVTGDIFSYAASVNKTMLNTASGDKNGSGTVERIVGLWRSTNAVTNIKLYPGAGNFASGTTATLYGILKA